MAIVIFAISIFILFVAYIGVSFILTELWIESRPTKRELDGGKSAKNRGLCAAVVFSSTRRWLQTVRRLGEK